MATMTMVGCGFKAANRRGARLARRARVGEARVARARVATRPMRAAAVDSGAGFAEAVRRRTRERDERERARFAKTVRVERASRAARGGTRATTRGANAWRWGNHRVPRRKDRMGFAARRAGERGDATEAVTDERAVFWMKQEGTAKERSFDASMRVPTSMARIGRQLGGGGAATLEKAGLSMQQQAQVSSPKLADGGGGGNNGGKINNGGGGGDGDEGDDDDYFEEGDDDDGEEGFFSTRAAIGETFDRKAIQAVLSEWFKTMESLPGGIRMAVEMGIVSSLALVRFMSVNVRPSVVRAVSRGTPQAFSRAFVGRLMADPAFLYKLAFEQVVTIGAATMYEVAHRGERLKSEWDLALSNIMQLSLANALTVWCCTPVRSFGSSATNGFQKFMATMPNNAFDRAGPLRQYTNATRGLSVVTKAAELSAVGVLTGGAFSAINTGLLALHKNKKGEQWEPAIPVPDLKTSALGMGAFLGISCNLRYQLLGGADRWMTEHLTSLASSVSATALGRVINNQLGEPTRLFALGLPMHASLAQTAGSAIPQLTKKKVVKKRRKVVKKRVAAAAATTTATPEVPMATA